MTTETTTKKAPKKETVKKTAAKAESKAVAKQEHKAETKTEEKKTTVKEAKKRKNPTMTIQKISKPDAIKKIRDRVEKKKDSPRFVGMFGKKSVRSVLRGKFSKWRKWHGIDLRRRNENGQTPSIGFSKDARVRKVHPSGYQEALIFSAGDLEGINAATTCARFSGKMGKAKRKVLIMECQKRGIHVVNF